MTVGSLHATAIAVGLALLAVAGPAASAAQVEAAVRNTEDGWLRFRFATREGVEICTRGVRYRGDRWFSRGGGGDSGCVPGPAEVDLRVRSGVVQRVELVDVAERSSRDVRHLGDVEPAEAARSLLAFAEGGATQAAARDALLPAFLADVPELWRDLARVAGDRALPADLRERALFWLGQEAAAAATADIAAVASADDEDQDVREAAVFALFQRPPEESVPILMDLARSAGQAKTRKAALFWLAQAEDARVLPFFQEILLGAN
jgi:hypothetical protein